VETSLVYLAAFLPLRLTLCPVLEVFLDGNGKPSPKLHLSDSELNIPRLFLTEGIATVIFGVVIWFLLPDCKELLPLTTKPGFEAGR
jgi:hypothetical protein